MRVIDCTTGYDSHWVYDGETVFVYEQPECEVEKIARMVAAIVR